MSYKLYKPRPGAKACDHFGHVTPEQCVALRADGFEGIFLYANVVSDADLAAATGAGLWVGFVLEGLAATTEPMEELGKTMAMAASARLRNLGVPQGVTIASDLEGDGRAPEAWVAFANGAADATTAAGDGPAAYVGEGLGLTSAELYALRVHLYWKSGSRIVDRHGYIAEPACGWAIVQGMPFDIVHASGIEYDCDVVWQDYSGRTLVAVIAETPQAA